MISVTDLRAGVAFLLDGQPYQVIKYKHSKIGRGTANVKVRVKNLGTFAVVEKTFMSGARVEEISVRRRKMQYLYEDQGDFCFMDPSSFEQITIEKEAIGEGARFLKEGGRVQVLFWAEKPLSVELPVSLSFEVLETDPGVKGDSASNIWKEAVLSNKVKIKVPLFIKSGDQVRVDTRTGEYLERAKE
jgi:elongation factor P